MLLKLIRTEKQKLKRSPIWLAFLFMPIIPAFLGTMNYQLNTEILRDQWYSLWTQHTLFTCYFFLPVLLGIYCAYTVRLEQNNHNWNKLLTMPMPRWKIFLSKLFSASFLVLLTEIWIGLLFLLSGKLLGLSAAVPSELPVWLLCGTLGGIVIVAIQLIFSLFLKSFALPIGISFLGGISGLAALAKGFGHLWPYSLMAYGMRANAPQELLTNSIPAFLFTCLFFLTLFTLLGSLYLTKKDF